MDVETNQDSQPTAMFLVPAELKDPPTALCNEEMKFTLNLFLYRCKKLDSSNSLKFSLAAKENHKSSSENLPF